MTYEEEYLDQLVDDYFKDIKYIHSEEGKKEIMKSVIKIFHLHQTASNLQSEKNELSS